MKFLPICLSFFVLFSTSSYSQSKKKKTAPSPKVVKPKNSGVTTTTQNEKPQTTTSNKSKDVPYEYVATSGSGGGINDTIKQSQRTDNIIERNLVKDRTPLVYEHIREDDAVYKQRIWRQIDAREKVNLAFRYSLIENNGSQRFINILINAIKNGTQAFSADDDDRFTTPITLQKALSQFGSKIDSTKQYDIEGNVVKIVIQQRDVDLDSIYKFDIKEEVVFDKESSRLFTRILGICPVMNKYTSEGIYLGPIRLFWLYYPDLRPTLARYECYNPKNFGARMSWEDLFESRMFSSYITKSTIDNPFDLSLKQKYGKNTLFALLEGDAIKEKIFSYEQDLWSY